LSPDEARKVQNIIKDVCKSLPVKASERW